MDKIKITLVFILTLGTMLTGLANAGEKKNCDSSTVQTIVVNTSDTKMIPL